MMMTLTVSVIIMSALEQVGHRCCRDSILYRKILSDAMTDAIASLQTLMEAREARRMIHAKLAARAARDSKSAAAAHFASLAASPAGDPRAASVAQTAGGACDAEEGVLRAISQDLAISEDDLACALSQHVGRRQHLDSMRAEAPSSRLQPLGLVCTSTDVSRPRSPTPDSAALADPAGPAQLCGAPAAGRHV